MAKILIAQRKKLVSIRRKTETCHSKCLQKVEVTENLTGNVLRRRAIIA